MKRHWKKLIPLLLVAAAYVLILHPAMNRGTVKLTIHNRTPEPLKVTEVSMQAVGETIEPGGKLRIVHQIGSNNTVTVYFESPLLESGPQPCEVAGYVERAYYGSASITVGYDAAEEEVTFTKESQIAF